MKRIYEEDVRSWFVFVLILVAWLIILFANLAIGLGLVGVCLAISSTYWGPVLIAYVWNSFVMDDEEQSHEDYNSYL